MFAASQLMISLQSFDSLGSAESVKPPPIALRRMTPTAIIDVATFMFHSFLYLSATALKQPDLASIR